jgi:hypothetical protein
MIKNGDFAQIRVIALNQEPIFWWRGEAAPPKNWFLILLAKPLLIQDALLAK